MRVAVTLEQCWHTVPGGTATSAIGSIRGLLAQGDHAIVGVSARHLGPPMPAVRPPIQVEQLPIPGTLLYDSWHRLRWPPVQRATGPVDVIHATGMAVPPRSAPLVVTVHDLAFLDHPELGTARGNAFFHRSIELARSHADVVVCPSVATRDACIANGFAADRIRVVPWGVVPPSVAAVDLAEVRARFALPEQFVLWVGTIEPRKNLGVLLRAFDRLDTDLPLVLVGPQGWNVELSGRLARLGPRVRSLGFVAPPQLEALYAAATVFCYPSTVEGFGMPVLEAMAHGTPVVTSADTAMAEVVGEAGVLVDPTDVQSLADALARVLGDDALRATLGEKAASRASDYPWSRTAAGLSAAYVAAAGGPTRQADGGDRAGRVGRVGRAGRRPPMAASAPITTSRPNRMRVGVNLLWLVPGSVGGSEDYTVRLLEAVRRHEHPDLALTLFVNRAFPGEHPELAAAFSTVVAPVLGHTRWRRVLCENVWLPLATGRRRIELTHHMGGLVPFVHLSSCIETLHDLQPLALPSNFSPVKRIYMRVWAPWSARHALRVITLTNWVSRDVGERTGVPIERIRVVPHGSVDVSPPTAGRSQEVRDRYGLGGDPFFLYPAITYPHKNHMLLVEAFRRVAAVHPTAKLVLTGSEAAEEDRVRHAIDAAGLAPRVARTGRIDENDLAVLFDLACAVVFPSRYEGCGLPVLEAMSHGTPVLASAVGGIEETAGDGALLIDPDDADAWAMAMVDLLRHDAKRTALAQAGRRHLAARPDWDESAAVLVGVYREVLEA